VSFKGRICSISVLDESVPGIVFDENGISNYAKLFQKLIIAYPRGEEGNLTWLKIVEKIKTESKNRQYDCIIGVSGGTDSSYLLHIAQVYKLHPLAVNLDNGWNSDIAVKNIKKMTCQLGIDLETYVIDYEEIKDLLRAYMLAGLPWIDIPTDLAIKAVLYKIAAHEGIKFILRGNDFRSEGSQPEEWTYGDGRQLNAIHKRYGMVRLNTFPNYTLSNLFYYGFFKKIKSIYPFYYLDYNKRKAQDFLTRTYGWEYYGGHHHENLFTKFAISYWLYEKFGIDKRKITLSAQILSKEITKETAIAEIKKKPYDPEEIDRMINFVLKKLDLSLEQFQSIMKEKNHSFYDYPSYNFIFTKMLFIAKPVLDLVFIHKPQSIFQAEMRNKK
jgi:N-acetyl sugar amidotransferase